MSEDRFVINRLRQEPITYTVTIHHFVASGSWQMTGEVENASMSTKTERLRVAADLRTLADWIEHGEEEAGE